MENANISGTAIIPKIAAILSKSFFSNGLNLPTPILFLVIFNSLGKFSENLVLSSGSLTDRQEMRECFQWLVRHEKLVVAVNFALVIALVGQLKFCKNTVEPETGPVTKWTPDKASLTENDYEVTAQCGSIDIGKSIKVTVVELKIVKYFDVQGNEKDSNVHWRLR